MTTEPTKATEPTEATEPREPQRMSPEEKREFFRECCDGRIFTDRHIEGGGAGMLRTVFCILALVDPTQLPDATKVGLVWEHIGKAGPRSVNGYPMFLSCHFMHVEDWIELSALIGAELKRRDEATEALK